MIDRKIWYDQADFNATVHGEPPIEHADRARATKDFIVDLETEIVEFVNAARIVGAHRRPDEELLLNHENIRRQLIDMFKYWMILCQTWGYTPEEMEQTYWRKTATVRQRYVAEWLTQLTGPVALVDLDGVLADYLEGMKQWIVGGYKDPRCHAPIKTAFERIMQTREFIDAKSLGISIPEWERINHEFRSGGGFARLPMMPYTYSFISWCRAQGLHVVAITSRAIDRYPNVYDDTVEWFAKHQLKVDKIWWGPNKAEKLASVKHLIPDVRFAIDDDPRYVDQFSQYGIQRVYWYKHGTPNTPIGGKRTDIVVVSNLREVIEKENQR